MARLWKVATIAIAAVLAITTLSGTAHAGETVPADVPNLGLFIVEKAEVSTVMPSQLFAVGTPGDASTYLMCKSADDERCLKSQYIWGIGGLDVCTPSTQMSCIQDMWAIDANGKKIVGQFVKDVQKLPNHFFDEIPAAKMSGSHSMGAIWKVPGVTNSEGTDEYFVAIENRTWAQKKEGDPLSAAKVSPDNFRAGITPIKEIAGKYGVRQPHDAETGYKAWGSWFDGPHTAPDGQECAVQDLTYCGIAAQFPAGYRFGITLRSGNLPTGWFSGRLGLPAITTSKVGGVDVLSIEAEPLQVPSLDFVVPNSEIPAEARKMAFDGTQWGRGGVKTWQIMSSPSDPKLLALMTAFTPAFKNTATSTDSTWSFNSMVGGTDSRNTVEKCANSIGSFGGIVTSNALTYSDGAPTFDATTGSLTYKVASPHFAANGKVALGTYDLAIRSSVVRCIYNFTNAPIQATISIVSDDGENKVATTVVSERNGWLYLSAKGFTFSSPTISVKMTQKAEATSSEANKKTIVCTKGKLSKKLIGPNPACPKGYIKKS